MPDGRIRDLLYVPIGIGNHGHGRKIKQGAISQISKKMRKSYRNAVIFTAQHLDDTHRRKNPIYGHKDKNPNLSRKHLGKCRNSIERPNFTI